MSEKLYALLLKLYPDHFRRTYGDEALRLVRDRAHDEKGFISGFRLWLDLLVDLAISMPREYSKESTQPIVSAQPANGAPSFELLAERSLNPAVLFLGGMLSAVLLWGCVTFVGHSRTFPVLFRDSLSLQWLVQSDLALARSPTEQGVRNSTGRAYSATLGAYSFCMTALRDIPNNSLQPLFTFNFTAPGASGVALIDGKIVNTFKNEQRLSIRADVFAGDHQFVLHLDRPVENTSISSNEDFQYCPTK
ncbi:MAG TPA: hypothetical protein VHY84_13495 [Bryobacteraceae bacterium]|jgi:hypothetical protein|nr:hypothetical protein [Bryobacteraceae bacterium]